MQCLARDPSSLRWARRVVGADTGRRRPLSPAQGDHDRRGRAAGTTCPSTRRRRRLYVSHATKVVVVDLDKDAVVGEIAPAPGVHGIAIAPELGRAFVSNGREATVSIVDLKTLQITADGQDRRQPGRDPVRARAQGGLRLQRARASRPPSSTRRPARCGRRSRCRASPSSRSSTRRRDASTTTSRTRASWSRSTPRPTRSSPPGRSHRARKRRASLSTPRATGSSSAAATT